MPAQYSSMVLLRALHASRSWAWAGFTAILSALFQYGIIPTIPETDPTIEEDTPTFYLCLGHVSSFAVLLWRVERIWCPEAGLFFFAIGGGGA